MGVVGSSIAVKGCEQREDGVCRRQRSQVAGACCSIEGFRGDLPALLDVTTQPVGCGLPCEQHRLLASVGAGVLETALLHGEGCIKLSTEVMDDADAPRQLRGQNLGAAGRALEAEQ